tara:strand:- start:15 stop:260 length:246 start_codon:yes stop_codon:yes gene_type:complete
MIVVMNDGHRGTATTNGLTTTAVNPAVQVHGTETVMKVVARTVVVRTDVDVQNQVAINAIAVTKIEPNANHQTQPQTPNHR